MKFEAAGLKSVSLFVELLNLKSLFFDILPVYREYKRNGRLSKNIIYVFDATFLSLCFARWLSGFVKWQVRVMDFEISDLRDQQDFSLRLRLAYQDLAQIQDKIIADKIFQDYISLFHGSFHLSDYLAKDIMEFDFTTLNRHCQFMHALALINISRWHLKDEKTSIGLFLRKRNWPEILREYALEFDVHLIFGAFFKNIFFDLKKIVRQFLARYVNQGTFVVRNLRRLFRKVSQPNVDSKRKEFTGDVKYTLGVEYYGHLNLERKDTYSDLFFYQQSQLRGEDIKLLFGLSQDPLDEKKWMEMQKQRISALVRFSRASCLSLDKVPIHAPWLVSNDWHLSVPLPEDKKDSFEFSVLRAKTFEYNRQFGYWKDLFEEGNIRLYTHWYKYDAKHIPLMDALGSLGGITTIYQRAFETSPTRELTVVADVLFCYNKNNFSVEKANRSDIAYQVVTGYLGDFRFSYLKEKAQQIALSLRKNGAERIISFLDENTLDDGRWFTGHNFTQKNYAYLIEKVLKDSRYGIIFKPKAPSNLRRRLGRVANMLDDLQKTGRCMVLSGGSLQGMYPPALAAMAADLTIHECLSAGSAGVEAALAGASTIFLDAEGWPVSPFYKDGLGKVVFQDLDTLWEGCSDFFEKPGAKVSIGNCNAFLDQVDPFRDGRAAERMGNYLKWLLDGLNAGLSRQTVLSDAADQYAQLWGKDKICFTNSY